MKVSQFFVANDTHEKNLKKNLMERKNGTIRERRISMLISRKDENVIFTIYEKYIFCFSTELTSIFIVGRNVISCPFISRILIFFNIQIFTRIIYI